MTIRQLKNSEVASVLAQIVKRQGNVCDICKKPFTQKDKPVLDHCHRSGYVRGALHNSCNGAEGKIKSKAQMGHSGVSPEDFIKGLQAYYIATAVPRYTFLHPLHKTSDQKRLKNNARARKRYAAKKA